MGWNSYNHFGCTVNETIVKGIADAMVEYGFLNAGYTYLNLDCGWSNHNRSQINNSLIPNPNAFPNGMTEYVHNKGLLFGIYGDAGTFDCVNNPGSLDAQTFAAWGVDYLKYDNCNNSDISPIIRYSKMRDALIATNRSIYYSICNWGEFDPFIWGHEIGNSWRTTVDIHPSWDSIMFTLDQQRNISNFSGPGGWNDPDMLEIGNGDLTFDEQKQDPLGRAVEIVEFVDGSYEIWTGILSDGYVAVLFNRESIASYITLNFETHCDIHGLIAVTDLWDADPFKGNYSFGYTAQIPSHGVIVLKLQV
ncbi:12368_t:CDS:10, partial [Gigaspora rosea]